MDAFVQITLNSEAFSEKINKTETFIKMQFNTLVMDLMKLKKIQYHLYGRNGNESA